MPKFSQLNKKDLILSGLYGMGFSFVLLNALVIGNSESFDITPNEDGRYRATIEESSFEAKITDDGNGGLSVHIKRRWEFLHYVVWACFAVMWGHSNYRDMQAAEKKRREKDEEPYPSSKVIPDEDPLYEEYLQGDSNRRLVLRAVNEKEFEEWKSKRGEMEESKQV